ncbi:HNH endonuclease [Kitasatospora sp. NPDC001574]
MTGSGAAPGWLHGRRLRRHLDGCGALAASERDGHKHRFTYRRHGGTDERNNLRLVHSECHRQHHAGDSKRTT